MTGLSAASESDSRAATAVGSPCGRWRWLALLVACSGMLMIVLDATIVTVALPTIQRDLRFSRANLAWVTNAYLITFGGLLRRFLGPGDRLPRPCGRMTARAAS